jgi:hypothetical protein
MELEIGGPFLTLGMTMVAALLARNGAPVCSHVGAMLNKMS